MILLKRILATACATACLTVAFAGTALAAEADDSASISALNTIAGVTDAEPTDDEPICYGYYIVTSSKTYMREAPDASAGEEMTLYAGAVVERTNNKTYRADGYKWYQVRLTTSDRFGYITTGVVKKTSFDPARDIGVTYADSATGRTYTTYNQGDALWSFPRSLEKKACVITTFAMLLKNYGTDATPRSVYDANGGSSLSFKKVSKAFDSKTVCALASGSKYLSSYDASTGRTYVKGGKSAVKEAVKRNPEGVLIYFKRGSNAHAVLAVKVKDGDIIYCDSGRSRGSMVTFSNTWCYHEYRMSYSNIAYMVAID